MTETSTMVRPAAAETRSESRPPFAAVDRGWAGQPWDLGSPEVGILLLR